MRKISRSDRNALTGKFVTKPIGAGKAAKFAAVEGITLSASSGKIAQKASADGLRGDAYRAHVAEAFKKR